MRLETYKKAAYAFGEWLLIASFLACTLFLYLSDYSIDAKGLDNILFLKAMLSWKMGSHAVQASAGLLLWVGAGVFAALMVLCYHRKRGQKLFIVFYELLFMGYGFFFWKTLIGGFCFFINPWLKSLALYYETELPLLVMPEVSRMEALMSVLCFLGLLLFLMAPAVGYLVCKGRGRLWFILCTILPLALKLLVGQVPQMQGFLAWGILFVVLLGTGRRDRTEREHKERVKSLFFLGGLLCLLGLVVSRGFTPNFYEEKVDVTKAKARLQKAEEALEKKAEALVDSWEGRSFLFGGVSRGGLSGGRLDTTGNLSYHGKTVLELSYQRERNLPQPLLLRGYIGELYTGSQWTMSQALRESKEYQELAEKFSAWGASIESQEVVALSDDRWPKRTVQITNKNAGRNRMYLPYEALEPIAYDKEGYLCLAEGKAAKEYELPILKRRGTLQWNMQRSLVSCLSGELYIDYMIAVGQYEQLAEKIYLQVPEDSKLVNYVKKDVKEKLRFGVVLEVVDYVQETLEHQAIYSLTPGMLPEGEDFADYFFFEKKEGYCMHFATAGVLMFRALGIPARYVEGYVLPEQTIREAEEQVAMGEVAVAEIPDKNAHAWVEIYMNGAGWMPIEVTPGYAMNSTGIESLPKELEGEDTLAAQEEASVPEQSEPPKASEAPKETDTNFSVPEASAKAGEKEAGNLEGEDKAGKGSILAWGFLGLAGIFIGAWLYRSMILWKKKRKMLQADAAGRISLYYREALRYLRHRGLVYEDEPVLEWGQKVEAALGQEDFGDFGEFAALAFKAAFGRELSWEEEKEAERHYRSFWKRVYEAASRRERLILKMLVMQAI